MVEKRQANTPKALWVLVVIGPVITAIEMQVNYVLVGHACSAQRNVALFGVTLFAMGLLIVSVIVGNRIWKRAGATWPGDDEDFETRVTFIAILAMLSSVMSFHIVVAQLIAIIAFDPCQL